MEDLSLTEPELFFVRTARLALRRLAVFRPVRTDPAVIRLEEMLDRLADNQSAPEVIVDLYHRLFAELTSPNGPGTEAVTGDAWQDRLLNLILRSENIYTRQAELGEAPDASLRNALRSELSCLQTLFRLDAATLRQLAARAAGSGDPTGIPAATDWPLWVGIGSLTIDTLPFNHSVHQRMREQLSAAADWTAMVDALTAYYGAAGAGLFGRFQAFRWTRDGLTGQLEGIHTPDPVRLSELIGYESERAEVIANTRQFLGGFRANNVLLYGDRGTGKSSTIKAILNEYAAEGLRLVEIPKQYLTDFPLLIRQLQHRPQRFIVYVDDLSFEENESEYKDLKAILEGGLEARPANVVIYATSNRRHLVRERFSDRGVPREIANDDEIRQQDTLQEKLSLADRFGIALTFTAPNQQRYLQIVEGLAAQRGLHLEQPVLHHLAIQWELWHNGRSGRTARQFIDYLEGKIGIEQPEA